MTQICQKRNLIIIFPNTFLWNNKKKMSEDPEKIKLDSPKSQIRIIPSSTSNLHLQVHQQSWFSIDHYDHSLWLISVLQPKKDETIQQPPPAPPPPPSHPLFFFENSEFGAGDLGASMERLSSQLSSSDRTSYMTESRPLSARQQVFQWLKRNSMVELKGKENNWGIGKYLNIFFGFRSFWSEIGASFIWPNRWRGRRSRGRRSRTGFHI